MKRQYGTIHQRLRKRWTPLVAGGSVRCARGAECRFAERLESGMVVGGLIHQGEDWDLDHDEAGGPADYLGPSHALCNRGAPGRRRGEEAAALTDRSGCPFPFGWWSEELGRWCPHSRVWSEKTRELGEPA